MTPHISRGIRNLRLVAGCTAALLLLSGCLNSSFYHPNQTVYETPGQYSLPYEEVFFKSGDGTSLHGWFIPASGEPIGTVIYFHGNYGNVSYYLKQVQWLPSKRFNVFTFDYRGYGRSEGIPSRAGIYEDSVAAIEYITSRPGFNKENVVVFGQSLGGANAIVAVAKNDFPEIHAVAVEGTFCSYRKEAEDMMASAVQEKKGGASCLAYPVRPVSFLAVSDSLSPVKYIDQVSPTPLLLIHCTDDSLVSYHHSDRLYEKTKEPKYRLMIEGCSHLNVFMDRQSGNEYRERLVQFFKDHRL